MKMYFVAIVLPEVLNTKVLGYKNFMQEKFRCTVGLKSPAHITIIPPFWMEEQKEQQLIADLWSISSSIETFALATNHFSAFKPRTIFIALQSCEQLDEVKKSADDYFSTRDYKIKKDERPFHPHITIATRDLHKRAFAEAWSTFSTTQFMEKWDAAGLSLLKHNGTKWEVVFTANFKASAIPG